MPGGHPAIVARNRKEMGKVEQTAQTMKISWHCKGRQTHPCALVSSVLLVERKNYLPRNAVAGYDGDMELSMAYFSLCLCKSTETEISHTLPCH